VVTGRVRQKGRGWWDSGRGSRKICGLFHNIPHLVHKNAGRGVGAAGIARKWEGERRGRVVRHESESSRQAARRTNPFGPPTGRSPDTLMYDSPGAGANGPGGNKPRKLQGLRVTS